MHKPVKVYTPLMRFEKMLFAIQDVKLPIPMTQRQIIIFGGSCLALIIFINLPGLRFMKQYWLIDAVIPIAITWFLTKFKFDGKMPHIYARDYLLYKLSSGIYNRYEKVEKPAKYRYKGVVTYRKGEENE